MSLSSAAHVGSSLSGASGSVRNGVNARFNVAYKESNDMFCVVQNGIDEPSLHELTSNEGGNIEREKGRLFLLLSRSNV